MVLTSGTRFGSHEITASLGAGGMGEVYRARDTDGRWIAHHALPPGTEATSSSGGVFVEPFPPTGARDQVPKAGRDFQPVWSREGAELYYISTAVSGQIAAVRVSTEAGLSFEGPTLRAFGLGAERLSGQSRAFDVLPDGRFVGVASATAPETLTPQVRFVINWFDELKRLVPTE